MCQFGQLDFFQTINIIYKLHFCHIILLIVCVELKTKYHVCLMTLFAKIIHDTNILFGKNLEFRYMVPEKNKIKNRH